jgi:hypothetical protein
MRQFVKVFWFALVMPFLCANIQDDPLCPEDITGDGVVSVNDLLALLSSFGSDCPC